MKESRIISDFENGKIDYKKMARLLKRVMVKRNRKTETKKNARWK